MFYFSPWKQNLDKEIMFHIHGQLKLAVHSLFFSLFFNSLYIQTRCWSYGVKFSNKNNLFLTLKPSLELSMHLLTSKFFSRASLQNFRLINVTIVLDNIRFRNTDIYLRENINDFLFKLVILHFRWYVMYFEVVPPSILVLFIWNFLQFK